jgi:hypothetical protein
VAENSEWFAVLLPELYVPVVVRPKRISSDDISSGVGIRHTTEGSVMDCTDVEEVKVLLVEGGVGWRSLGLGFFGGHSCSFE